MPEPCLVYMICVLWDGLIKGYNFCSCFMIVVIVLQGIIVVACDFQFSQLDVSSPSTSKK